MKYVKLFEGFSNVEDLARLNKKVLDLLNGQVKNELESSQIYRAMACWLDNNGWTDAAKYFFKSGQEELVHMDKIYQYIFSMNSKAVTPACGEVKGEFSDIREILTLSLEHEMKVSEQWNNISTVAAKEGDMTTHEFAMFFVKEQVEEEEKFRDILLKLDLDMPKWKLEELFEELND